MKNKTCAILRPKVSRNGDYLLVPVKAGDEFYTAIVSMKKVSKIGLFATITDDKKHAVIGVDLRGVEDEKGNN